MQQTTVDALIAVLRSDRTVSPTERQRLVTLFQGELGEEPQPDRLLRRAEAARLLGRSTKAIDRLTERGVLTKVTFPGYKRAAGFRLSDVVSVIAGGNHEPQDRDAAAGG